MACGKGFKSRLTESKACSVTPVTVIVAFTRMFVQVLTVYYTFSIYVLPYDNPDNINVGCTLQNRRLCSEYNVSAAISSTLKLYYI